ncbi:MAG TPA: ABC transporter permease [Solirubrobacterales bacterium]|nr:ABC transporter permease [Solirubrobacterales bacterium]
MKQIGAKTKARSALRYLGSALLTLWVISVLVFAGTNIRPAEDVARQALGRTVTESQLQTFIDENGLDRPLPQRYASWLGDFVQGDWGESAVTGRPVRPAIVPRLWRSLLLALAAALVAVPISVLLGIFMARRRQRRSDVATNVFLAGISALPEFVVGLALTTVFAVSLGWLPVDSTALTFGSASDKVLAYVLPAATLVILVVPYIARVTRAAVSETLQASYTRAAVLRGLQPRIALWDFAVRNAAVPILNAVAINFIYMLGGVIVVENVFGFPGIGQLLVQSIGRADVITVQAAAMTIGAIVILINMSTDGLAVYFTPKLRGRKT